MLLEKSLIQIRNWQLGERRPFNRLIIKWLMKFVFSGRAEGGARSKRALGQRRAATRKAPYLITPHPQQKNCREKVSSRVNVNEMKNCIGRFSDYSRHKINSLRPFRSDAILKICLSSKLHYCLYCIPLVSGL